MLGVDVGNLSQAAFQMPRPKLAPTVLQESWKIIHQLQRQPWPRQGVALHLSLSDSECQVCGAGHLEAWPALCSRAPICMVGLLDGHAADPGHGPKSQRAPAGGPFVRLNPPRPRVTIAVRPAAHFPGAASPLLRSLEQSPIW